MGSGKSQRQQGKSGIGRGVKVSAVHHGEQGILGVSGIGGGVVPTCSSAPQQLLHHLCPAAMHAVYKE